MCAAFSCLPAARDVLQAFLWILCFSAADTMGVTKNDRTCPEAQLCLYNKFMKDACTTPQSPSPPTYLNNPLVQPSGIPEPPSPLPSLQRPPHPRIDIAHILLHHIPVDALPPRLEELPLPAHAIVPQPHMLPRVDPEQHLQVLAARRELGAPARRRVRADRAGRAVQVQRVRLRIRAAGDVRGRGGHVARLLPEVRARVGGAGDVGRQ